jgi:hypothetical protein
VFDLNNPQTLLAGGMLTGLLLAFWGKLKVVAWRVFNLFVVVVEFHGDAATPVAAWLTQNGRRLPGGTRWYFGFSDYLRPKKRTRTVLVEGLSTDAALYRVGRRFLWANYHKTESPNNYSGFDINRVTFWFFRGMFDPDRIGFAAVEAYCDRREKGDGAAGRHGVTTLTGSRKLFGYGGSGMGNPPGDVASPVGKTISIGEQPVGMHLRLVGYKREDLGQPVEAVPFVGLYYPPEIHGAVAELGHWLKSEEWYRRKGIPWRRSFLLAGPPGNGKSRLTRAVAQQFDLPVFVFDLATMDNQELDASWRGCLMSTPCIALFEDIDGVFEGRKNVLGEKSGLTFDKLLQCLSGVASSDGVFVVLTTNRPEVLDPAIGRPDGDGDSSRPGRVDRVVHMGPPDDDCRRQIIESIMGDCSDERELAQMTAALRGKSAAQVSEHAARLALERYWTGAHGRLVARELPMPVPSQAQRTAIVGVVREAHEGLTDRPTRV